MLRKTCIATVSAMLVGLSLIGPSAASAATEVGNTCVGDNAETPPSTLVQLARDPAATTPIAVPQAGVVTKWKVNVIPYPGGISEKLKVLRPAPGANSFTAIGESTVQPIAGGSNSFDTRIPVQAGDRMGAFSPLGTIFCQESATPADVMGEVIGDVSLGSTATFTAEPKAQVAVSAVVEPDADNDGYGDETQDKCPQSAAFQSDCPVVAVDAASAIKRKGSVTVLVTTTSSAPVVVKGTVNLGKGKKAKLSGGSKTVTPGKIARFTLKFSKKLKAKLKDLSTKQSLQLKIVATATDVVGRKTTDKLKVKLKGQAKTG